MKAFLFGSSHPELAQKFQNQTSRFLVSQFADKEIRVEIEENLKDKEVLVFQSTSPPVNDHYMELFILLDAALRAGAKKITVWMPYMGYGRQDRLMAQGSPVSAELMVEFLKKMKVEKIITLDFHSKKILNLFPSLIQNVLPQKIFAEEWKKAHPQKEAVCVSPDQGGIFRAQELAKALGGWPISSIEKKRPRPNAAMALCLKGSVKGQNCIIVDDMIDTAGTLCTAVDSLIQNGAEDIFVLAAHGLFSGQALERIEKAPIKEVWITDSIRPRKEVLECPKIQIIPSEKIWKQAGILPI